MQARKMKSRSLLNKELLNAISEETVTWFLSRPYSCGKFTVKYTWQQLEFAIKIFKKYNAKNLLILGGGSGIEAAYIKNKILEIEVTNTDISEKMVQISKIRSKKDNLFFKNEVADAEELKYSSRKFDFVLITGAFHHIQEQEKAFHQMCRVAGKGVVFISEKAWTFTRKIARMFGLEQKEFDGLYGFSISLKWLKARAKEEGFDIVKKKILFSDRILPKFFKKDRMSKIGLCLYNLFNMLFGFAGPGMNIALVRKNKNYTITEK